MNVGRQLCHAQNRLQMCGSVLDIIQYSLLTRPILQIPHRIGYSDDGKRSADDDHDEKSTEVGMEEDEGNEPVILDVFGR